MKSLHAGYKTLRAATDKIKKLEKKLASTGVRYFDVSLKKTLDEINPVSQRKY